MRCLMIHNLMESPKNLDLSETSTFENCLSETSVAETSWSETSVAETSVHHGDKELLKY